MRRARTVGLAAVTLAVPTLAPTTAAVPDVDVLSLSSASRARVGVGERPGGGTPGGTTRGQGPEDDSSVRATASAPRRGVARAPTERVRNAGLPWDGHPPSATLPPPRPARPGPARLCGRLEAIRLFDPALPALWSSARAKATAGRTVIISFRPMPVDVLSGKYDAELRAFFTQAPSNQTIYWSYIHEPEPFIDQGTFTADQYRQAWQRIAGFADAACKPNMHATLILTGWTAEPGSKRSVSTYYPGDSVIDVIAWDPYNGVSDPTRSYYASATEMFGNTVAATAALGKPYAIAETGSRLVPGDSGAGRAAWLTSIGQYLRAHNAVFATYVNSTRDASWKLDDEYSSSPWDALTASRPRPLARRSCTHHQGVLLLCRRRRSGDVPGAYPIWSSALRYSGEAECPFHPASHRYRSVISLTDSGFSPSPPLY